MKRKRKSNSKRSIHRAVKFNASLCSWRRYRTKRGLLLAARETNTLYVLHCIIGWVTVTPYCFECVYFECHFWFF